MGERRTQPSSEPVYSEADLAEFRLEWEAAQEKRQLSDKLSNLEGQLKQMPETIKAQVRTEVRAVLAEEKRADDTRRRNDIRLAIAIVGALLVLVVPLENVLLNVVIHGHP